MEAPCNSRMHHFKALPLNLAGCKNRSTLSYLLVGFSFSSLYLEVFATVTRRALLQMQPSVAIVVLRACPYKKKAIQVSKFPSARTNRLVIQLGFLVWRDSSFVNLEIQVNERCFAKFINPSFITCLNCSALTTTFAKFCN
jgi:hypothetical protein